MALSMSVGKTIISQAENTYHLEQALGQGGFGEVWRAKREGEPKDWAIKILTRLDLDPNQRKRELGRFVQEIHAQIRVSGLSSRVIHVEESGEILINGIKHPFYVMEYLADGSLEDHLGSQSANPGPYGRTRLRLLKEGPGGIIDWQQAKSLWEDLLEAAGCVHQINMFHCDIKPSNLMFGWDEKNVVFKLGDMGLSRTLLGSSSTGGRSPGYAPPEQYYEEGTELTRRPSVDIFPIGVIAYLLIARTHPYLGSDYQNNIRSGNIGKFFKPEQLIPTISSLRPELKKLLPYSWRQLDQLLLSMVAYDYTQRPASIAEIRKSFLTICEAKPQIPKPEPPPLAPDPPTIEVQSPESQIVPATRTELRLFVGLLLVLLAGGGWVVFAGRKGEDKNVQAKTESATAEVQVPPSVDPFQALKSRVEAQGDPETNVIHLRLVKELKRAGISGPAEEMRKIDVRARAEFTKAANFENGSFCQNTNQACGMCVRLLGLLPDPPGNQFPSLQQSWDSLSEAVTGDASCETEIADWKRKGRKVR